LTLDSEARSRRESVDPSKGAILATEQTKKELQEVVAKDLAVQAPTNDWRAWQQIPAYVLFALAVAFAFFLVVEGPPGLDDQDTAESESGAIETSSGQTPSSSQTAVLVQDTEGEATPGDSTTPDQSPPIGGEDEQGGTPSPDENADGSDEQSGVEKNVEGAWIFAIVLAFIALLLSYRSAFSVGNEAGPAGAGGGTSGGGGGANPPAGGAAGDPPAGGAGGQPVPGG
jgi:hypothetical protein